ncbi:Msr family ABC-F type ribosomal protection protein [Halalkalibacillus halophilus]|uniref:Msr family ABC-F type ribosomal protection protein n=1 Tax=Halalkalibacillus halophilus TaxID=392827 RepID=UPI0003FBF428|nr:ABC-F type ribosomal protection protein [Halalkalibacillus halophilus]
MERLVLELKDIEVTYLDQQILDLPDLAVHQFDRIGIVGKNGQGKSTLLKLIDGRIKPNRGHVHKLIEFGYFDQTQTPEEGEMDYKLASMLAVPELDTSYLSGGEKTRKKLVQLLSTYFEGMLIDEPTTHLDQTGVDFFLEEMRYYYGALIIVSHDRYVLDQLVDTIWEVDRGKVNVYSGNYTDYLEQKELEKKQQIEQLEKYEKEKSRLLRAAEEKKSKASKINEANNQMSKKESNSPANRMFMTKSKGTSQKSAHKAAKAIEQRVEQMDTVEPPTVEKELHFYQSPALQLHNKFPIMGDRVTVQMSDKVLLDQVNFQFPLGQTIAITGDNGAGKTSLIKHILSNGNGIDLSPKVVFGVYQQLDYQFHQSETVIEFMKNRSDHQKSRIRAVLHAMDFTGNDLKKDVMDLSGGEAIRLVLCELFLGKYNVIVLDEPTTFLDLHCIQALETFIKAYPGTIMIVSHDRWFIERTADYVYEIKNKKLELVN